MYHFSNKEFSTTWYPKIDVTESIESFLVRFTVPGVDPEDVKLHVENDSLSISGFKIIERDIKNDNTRTHIRERHTDRFNQLINLDSTIDSKKITANLSDGILSIEIPKKCAQKIDIIIE